jgi:hypothetical protein
MSSLVISGGPFGVPVANSDSNSDWGDVIGSKEDTHEGDSLYSRVDEIFDSQVSERKVYPTLAAGATLVSANANWVFGAYATVVPANVITSDFHVLGLSIESCDRDAVFEMALYQGAGDDIITSVRFAIQGGFFGNQVYIVGSEHIAANSQVRGRLASSNGLAQIATITMSVIYHEHP